MSKDNSTKKIACFGELLLRLSPDTDGQCWQAHQLPAFIGGAELNVASALGAWGAPVKFITALPANELSETLQKLVEDRNVELVASRVPDSRLGLYYLPQGADLKAAGVIYDRSHSAFAGLQPGQIDWQRVLADVDWLHISAINPGLNATLVEVCEEALKKAKEMGVRISIDLNYRPKLWKYGADPVVLMPRLLAYADIVMGNIWAAEKLLGIPALLDTSEGKTDEELITAAKTSTAVLRQQYPQAQEVVYTFRLANRYFSVAQQLENTVVSRCFPIREVVDRAGSGDCFMAGFIYGKRNGYSLAEQLNLAAAAAVQKMTERGDATQQPIDILKQNAFS